MCLGRISGAGNSDPRGGRAGLGSEQPSEPELMTGLGSSECVCGGWRGEGGRLQGLGLSPLDGLEQWSDRTALATSRRITASGEGLE